MKNRYFTILKFIIFDFLFAFLSLLTTLLIKNQKIVFTTFNMSTFSLVVLPFIVFVAFYIFKIYNILWRFFNLNEAIRMFFASLISVGALFVSQRAVFRNCFSFDTLILFVMIFDVCIIALRYFYKNIIYKIKSDNNENEDFELSGNIMIIGAGSAGETIINEFANNKIYRNCKIKCVIDDDVSKIGMYISGIRIVGGRDSIIEAAEKYDISTIVFAIPAVSNVQKSEILNICQKTKCKLKIVPSVCSLENFGEISSKIRKVEIEDLLGRDPIDIAANQSMGYVTGKVVLVTGGGGTIGSELCRQISVHKPKQLIIFDIYENNAYEIQNELKRNFPELNLETLIGSVRDSKRMDYIFRTYKPEIVYHAAAHKHVPLMEDSPNETVKNNVFGTFKTAECADRYGVEKFVLISTDKAVNPTNIMGASKRICEMIVQYFNTKSETEFVAVRFGNVLGSNGSVIPLFKKQIEEGGPVTVTSPNIIRYFMTIPEAVSLVLQAGASAKGGEIFVLDMGAPVKILDLAENLIRLSGFVPYKDIQIVFTGLRPGEKLYEELLMSEEGLKSTDNELIFIGRPIDFDEKLLIDSLKKMKNNMYDESYDIRSLVKKIVPTYQYSKNDDVLFK